MKSSVPIFHAFTIKYPGVVDRVITELEVSDAFDPSHEHKIFPSRLKTLALWDTGATKSVITKKTAESLELVPSGTVDVNHAGGRSRANTYVTNFFMPNSVCIIGVLVSECPDISNNVGAIIGMDIIAKGDFSLTHVNGLTCMSYRLPSIQRIDYVEEANREKFRGIGRNDQCPCGKVNAHGKRMKFKQCCGASLSS